MRVGNFFISLISFVLIGASAQARSPVEIDGLDSFATVIRDSDGVVHILARTEHDLMLMQGWAHARDRLFQMDTFRRTASGTLAELLGEGALASDVELRVAGLRRAAERSLTVLSPESQAALDAYAVGVNAFVAANPLPQEYLALELTSFEPWNAVDSLAVAKLLAFLLSFDLVEEIERTVALQTYMGVGGVARFDGEALFFQDVNRSAPFDPASTVPDSSAPPPAPAAVAALRVAPAVARADGNTIRPETLDLARDYLTRLRTLPYVDALFGPSERARGSNEWVVSGAHTVSGQPLLANDPHLSVGMPAIWHPIHLRARPAGFDVIGASLPGAPFVILGNNRRISWGATNHRMDDTDVFEESLVINPDDPTLPAGLGIFHDGAVEPIIPLPQIFRVNVIGDGGLDTIVPVPPVGGIPPAVLIVPRRNNGPIVNLNLATRTALSVMYTGFSGTREIDAFRGFNLARDLDDFVDALQQFDFGSQNWAYADIAGNIAYYTSAEVPLRRDLQTGAPILPGPAFIRDGSRADTDWLPLVTPQPGQAIPFEILPFEEMAQIVNPPAGYFVNANNDTNGDTLDNNPLDQLRRGGGIRYIAWEHQMGLRAGRITSLLRDRLALGPVTAEDMREIQADVIPQDTFLLRPLVVDAFAAAIAPGADPALAAFAADPRLREAAARFASWDGSMPTGLDEGYDASDVEGERLPPTRAEIDASVAATLYSVWRGRLVANTIDATLDAFRLPRPDDERSLIGLGHLLETFSTNSGFGASGLNFFNVPGVADAATRRDIIVLRSLQEALDLLASDAFANAFGNSTLQDDYRWGRLHRVVLPSAVGGPFTRPSPLGNPPGFATDGGYRTVDPGASDLRIAGDGDSIFDDGASRRYVAEFGGGHGRIGARSSLPGGVSGELFSPFYDNLLEPWLTNDTYPLRQSLPDVFRSAVEFQVVRPPVEGDDDDDGDDDD